MYLSDWCFLSCVMPCRHSVDVLSKKPNIEQYSSPGLLWAPHEQCHALVAKGEVGSPTLRASTEGRLRGGDRTNRQGRRSAQCGIFLQQYDRPSQSLRLDRRGKRCTADDDIDTLWRALHGHPALSLC